MIRDIQTFYDVVDGTWPAKSFVTQHPWLLRAGDGGGKRVSAATALGAIDDVDITSAEAAMREMGQSPLFMLRDGEDALDSLLAQRGYEVIDPVRIYAISPEQLTGIPVPPVTTFAVWEPLAIMEEIWAQGGVDGARLRVMARAKGPKTGLLCRLNEKPAGVAYVAIHKGIAMLHALEVLPHQRRQGAAAWLMRAAAFWAQENGAQTLSVITVNANAPANALYRSLGFSALGGYHYRHWREDTT